MTNCPICGEKLSQDSKYCPGCGSPVQKIGSHSQPTTLQCTCKNCGGTMNYDREQSLLHCPFCGAKEIVIEDEDITIARIRSDAYKEIELKKMEQQGRKRGKTRSKAGSGKLKSVSLSVILIILSIFCFMLALGASLGGDKLSGMIACAQGALFLFAWLLMVRIIKKPSIRYSIPLVVGLILIIPFIFSITEGSYRGYSHDTPDSLYSWPVGSIADAIPQPDSEYGTIYYQSEEDLNMDVRMDSITEFREYINDCKDMGYTVDVNSGNTYFSAFNEEGYHIDLYYYESDQYMSLTLDAPVKMTTFRWPASDIAQTIPAPQSDYGLISWENSTGFDIIVGNTTEEEYEDYCAACMDAGYTVEYSKGKGYFNAEDDNGNRLSIYYEGNKTMRIHLYEADD